jgi:hypothetical protein
MELGKPGDPDRIAGRTSFPIHRITCSDRPGAIPQAVAPSEAMS